MRTPPALLFFQSALYLVLVGQSPGIPEFVHTAWLATVKYRVSADDRPSAVAPYVPYANDIWGDPLDNPHHAIRATAYTHAPRNIIRRKCSNLHNSHSQQCVRPSIVPPYVPYTNNLWGDPPTPPTTPNEQLATHIRRET